MATSVLPPQQHTQPSRKGKKAWRKNVDTTEVEAGLEVVRDEVIQGGILAEKSSDSLFAIEPTGSKAIQQAYNKEHKPLKSDEILAQRSAVPALDQRKRKAEKTTDGVLPTKRRKAGIAHKELERLRGIAYGGDAVHKDVVKANGAPVEDLWAMDGAPSDAKEEDVDERFSFLEKAKPIRAPPTIKHTPISLLANGKALPAVPKPLEGRSYNPSFEAWDALIQHYGAEEVSKERKRLGDAAAATELSERIARSADVATKAEQEDEEEASAWESEWEGFMSEKEDADVSAAWLNKKRPERKTKAERNKIARRKDEERRKKHDAHLEERERQLLEIKKLAAENKTRSSSKALAVKAPDSSDDELPNDELRRRALGKMKIPEAPLELILAEELQDSLRGLRPEGNLLQDRFRNMQLRGKIEARKPITQPKKARRKATEKWSYKDWKLKY